MKVSSATAKKQAADGRQHRIAKISVKWRQRAWLDTTTETVAHHQIIALPQLLKERKQICKIITVICIAHDHIIATCGLNSRRQGAALSAHDQCEHPRAPP